MKEKHRLDRREFLKAGSAALAGAAAGSLSPMRIAAAEGPPAGAVPPSEQIIIGLVGAGGRAGFLADYLAGRPDARVAWVADPDSNRAASLAQRLEKSPGGRPRETQDFRHILDAKDVDALVVATPDHWHAIPTVMGCQAGKDVYVEKPASHNIFEGQCMVKAARKYERVVQLGTQNRSAPFMFEALDYIRSGKLGDVHLIRVFNMKNNGSIGRKADAPTPAGVDYDMWLGPAPARPFNPNRFHGAWYYRWDYSNGDIINDGIHQIDIGRWIVGRDYPDHVSATGGLFHFDDDQETPDTLVATYAYPKLTMTFELTLWTPYMEKISEKIRNEDLFPDWRFCATRVEIFGTNGMMMLGRHGGGWQVYAPDHSIAAQAYGRIPLAPHMDNFFDCIKSRKKPNADIEEGHRSTLLAHMANASYKLGGRQVRIDPATEKFVNDDEAQALATRTFREPWGSIMSNV